MNPSTENGELPKNVEELLYSYFSAFANLYGIIPLYRALRIIQKQNPELLLTKDDFLLFANKVAQEHHLYIIAGEEDIYSDITEPTPPLNREIIAEHLYAVDNFESYDVIKEAQADKPFYIPEKERLLKYQDEFYFEETKESTELSSFLQNELRLKEINDILFDLYLSAHLECYDIIEILNEVELAARKKCFFSREQVVAFAECYFTMCENTRVLSHRGFTPHEMWERLGDPSVSVRPDVANLVMYQNWNFQR